MRRGGGFVSDEKGQALVEFAITVPILLFLLLGIIDFARAWNSYEVLTDAGREAARFAVVDNGQSLVDKTPEIRTIVRDAAARAGLTVSDADIIVTGIEGRGEPTTVTINHGHDLQWVGGLMGLVGADRIINFTVVSTMRRE